MKIKHIALLVLSAVVFSACTQTAVKPSPTPDMKLAASPATEVMTQTIQLTEQNASGQSGTAVVTEGPNGNAVVTLTLSGGIFTAPQPAHVHVGSCPTPGAVKYPLSDVVNGMSVTTLDASYEDMTQATDKLAINVHKSASESKVYTACGDVN